MEASILVTTDGSVMVPTGFGASDVRRAWVAVGRPGRALTIGAGVACLVVTAMWVTVTIAAVATGVSLLIFVGAALVDVVEHRLPNALVVGVAGPVVVTAAVASVFGAPGIVVDAVAGAAFLGVPLLLTHLVSPAGMGFGDVKAGFALGAALGLINAQIAVLALVIGLATAAAGAIVRRRRTIPLGPGLVLGALVALLVARLIDVGAASW